MERRITSRFALIGLFLLFATNLWASPPSRTYTYSSGAILDPAKNTTNEINLYNYLSAGVDTYADGSIINADISGSAAITYGKLSLSNSILNGDISSSAGIIASKLSLGGVVLPSGAVFFMVTGSCPTGTTDVSATYSNKFVRINATGGSTSGADTHTHEAGTLTTEQTSSYTTITIEGATNVASFAHVHDLSGDTASGDNVPAYVTCKMCQVN